MPLRRPSQDDLLDLSDRHHLQITEAELPDLHELILGVMEGYDELDQYPDPVRVVVIGAAMDDVLADPGSPRWQECSIELCGGTHLADTSAADHCVIVHEQALAAGVRRIPPVTGAAAPPPTNAGESRLGRAGRGKGQRWVGCSGPRAIRWPIPST